MRWVLLVLVACGSPTRFPEQRWESAPPPPKPAPAVAHDDATPASMGMRERIADKLESKLDRIASKPSPYEQCPRDLSLAVNRLLDGRIPSETIKARYAKQHGWPVRDGDLIQPALAIGRVIAIESQQPIVVPAGFRARIIARGRDAGFRLHMARCELNEPTTLRRASYDAAIAYLLGAEASDVLPILRKSMHPDGARSRTCRAQSDCGNDSCDPITRMCTTERAKTAAFLSKPELDIEDLLVRALVTKITPAQLESDRYDPEDVVGAFVYGRYTRCDGMMCTFVRSSAGGKTQLIYRDRRYIGEGFEPKADPWETCRQETGAVTRGGCIAKCEGDRGSTTRASCVATCTSLCPIAPPNSPAGDDD